MGGAAGFAFTLRGGVVGVCWCACFVVLNWGDGTSPGWCGVVDVGEGCVWLVWVGWVSLF